MKQENFNIAQDSKGKYPGEEPPLRKLRILVVPLDWGLGHATRCIPVIYGLVQAGCDVWLAGEDPQQELLRQEFPHLPFLSLAGYRIKYGRSAWGMIWNMLGQSLKIIRAIKQENEWLKEKVNEFGFDAVISDNRYGLHHPNIPCIFITHQLTIRSPLGSWSERLLQKRNYKYINHFTECWIPDQEDENNLAGKLSHPEKKPAIPLRYIGPLSRFENTGDLATENPADHLLIILSGPEPQRTILEEIIIKDIAHYSGSATIVRGLPGAANLIPSTNTLKFYNHLPAKDLNNEMNKADYVISRSGYSMIMDIVKLQKKSILISTPGQTEQEYLAQYLREKKIAATITQKEFSLSSALKLAKSFSYTIPALKKESQLQQVIIQFVQGLGLSYRRNDNSGTV